MEASLVCLLCRDKGSSFHKASPVRSQKYLAERRFTSSPPRRRVPSWKLSAPTSPSVHPDPHDTLPLPEQLRSVMRLLPHSVVVCTAMATEAGGGGGGGGGRPGEDKNTKKKMTPRGMTMSSFTSLSLRPTPIVTFNIATPSRTLDAVTRSREFNIHVLSGDVEGARVAEWFRRGNADGLGVFDQGRMWEGCGCEYIVAPPEEQQQQRQQQKQREVEGEGEVAPLLRGKGVLYAMRCRVLDDTPAGGLVRVRDHVVVLAEVVEIVEGEGGPAEVFGLAYADRRYRVVGDTMVHREEE